MRAIELVRPLPLRLEPHPNEAFRGYLERAATVYDLPVQALLSPLRTPVTGCASEKGLAARARLAGLTATTNTREKLADRFNLTGGEVDQLFVDRYRPYVRFSAVEQRLFDPFLACVTLTPALAPSRGVDAPRVWRFCPLCRAENPHHWETSWRLSLHQICVRQHVFLTHERGGRPTVPATPVAVDAQRQVLASLEDPSRHLGRLQTIAAAMRGDFSTGDHRLLRTRLAQPETPEAEGRALLSSAA